MIDLFRLIVLDFRHFVRLFKSYRRIARYAKKLLAEAKGDFPDWHCFVDKVEERRMWDYIIIQTLWTSGFTLLRGEDLKDNELKTIVNLSALAPLYDDFFDKLNKTPDEINFLVNFDSDYKMLEGLESIFVYFAKGLKRNVKDLDIALLEAKNVSEAQYLSKKLVTTENMSFEEIKSISYNKGASTVICMGNLLNKKLNNDELNIMGSLGGFAQFLDDVFDYKDDFDEGRQTLINNDLSLAEVKSAFIAKFNEFKSLLAQSNFTEKRKKSFLIPIALLAGATITCFKQYEELMIGNRALDLRTVQREAMICDMDKFKNRIDAIKNAQPFLSF